MGDHLQTTREKLPATRSVVEGRDKKNKKNKNKYNRSAGGEKGERRWRGGAHISPVGYAWENLSLFESPKNPIFEIYECKRKLTGSLVPLFSRAPFAPSSPSIRAFTPSSCLDLRFSRSFIRSIGLSKADIYTEKLAVRSRTLGESDPT